MKGKKGDEAMPFPNLMGWLIALIALVIILFVIMQARGMLDISQIFSAGRG
jgi:preprotein translocase subunit SecG